MHRGKKGDVGNGAERVPTGIEIGFYKSAGDSSPDRFQPISTQMIAFVSENKEFNCYVACVVMLFATAFDDFFLLWVTDVHIEELRTSLRTRPCVVTEALVEIFALLHTMVMNAAGPNRAEGYTARGKKINTDLTVLFITQMRALKELDVINGDELHMDVVKTYEFCVWLCCMVYRIKRGMCIIRPDVYYTREGCVVDKAYDFFCVSVKSICSEHCGDSHSAYFPCLPRNFVVADQNGEIPALRAVSTPAAAKRGPKRRKAEADTVNEKVWGAGFSYQYVLNMEVSHRPFCFLLQFLTCLLLRSFIT